VQIGPPTGIGRQYKKLLEMVALVVLLVLLDQMSKAIIRTTLAPGESVRIIDGFVRITFVQNFRGLSWWVPALPSWITTAFFVTRVVILLLAFPFYSFYTQIHRRSAWAAIACVAIAAGVLGNLLDDLFLPYTTDFIQFFNWPSPNVADIYAFAGIVALMVECFWFLRTTKPRWRGFRHYVSFEKRAWKAFFEYLRGGEKRNSVD
jgi:signal peptidase II